MFVRDYSLVIYLGFVTDVLTLFISALCAIIAGVKKPFVCLRTAVSMYYVINVDYCICFVNDWVYNDVTCRYKKRSEEKAGRRGERVSAEKTG